MAAKYYYLALLRGINVGGNNIIKMVALKACFENAGFGDVVTCIQSGNVIFSSSEKSGKFLEERIEKALMKDFNLSLRLVVIPFNVLQKVVAEAPKGFGKKPDEYRYDVLFLKKPLTPQNTLKVVEIREGVDFVAAGKHAVYFYRLIKEVTHSKISKIIQKPEYKFITIRNWNTTTKLLALMEKFLTIKDL